MYWWILLLAGLFEVTWAVGLKYSNVFSKFWPSVLTIVAMLLSFAFLAWAVKGLPLGTAYAVWTGIGVLGTATWGIIVFHEPRDVVRIICIVLVLVGILGLRLTAKA